MGRPARRAVIWPPDAFDGGPFRHHLGLRRVPADEWIDLDVNWDAQVAEKARVVAAHRTQVLIHDGAQRTSEAVDELLADVRAAVLRQAPDAAEHFADVDADEPDPLARLARSAQEDWVILDAAAPGMPVMAGCVCFPTRWDLPAKLGQSVMGVHAPVHAYESDIGDRVDKFMRAIDGDQVWMRTNWNVVDSPSLFQPVAEWRGPGPNPAVTADNAGETLLLRVERETLRRLASSDTMAFGIRVHTTPLSSLLPHDRDRLDALVASTRHLPDEMGRYKSVPAFADALYAWHGALPPTS